MADFIYRTEDFTREEILNFFVEIKQDREIIDALKARNPIILIGSRGVGKSFLLRVAQGELISAINKEGVFPIYVTFSRSSLIHTKDPNQFHHWMLARLCSHVIRALRKAGFLSAMPTSLSILAGSPMTAVTQAQKTKIEQIAESFEESWKSPGVDVDIDGLPSIDDFREAIENLCSELRLRRFAFLIDEAAHIFYPDQQRQFFTLFRDLRSPYITCNAAVYPGVTYFGETFQPAHDATMLSLDRYVLSEDYLKNMSEIVAKQADSTLMRNIARNRQNFALLAYAASGNPRILLKTIARASKVNSQQVNELIREYYRTDIWSEHSTLADKYLGHRSLIDWGRRFIENEVLPELQKKNAEYISTDRKSTCFFWIHRDAPQPVKESLRLLAYTGIVTEHSTGIKATRSEIGTRYSVNLGSLFSLEPTPTSSALQIAKNLTPKRMSEYGANYSSYRELMVKVPKFVEPDMSDVLERQLAKPIEVLDITNWQKDRLYSMDLNTIGDVLQATETKLQQAYYVGEKRARRMRNAAIAAVYEYLSG